MGSQSQGPLDRVPMRVAYHSPGETQEPYVTRPLATSTAGPRITSSVATRA
jgi:hypothetical protein